MMCRKVVLMVHPVFVLFNNGCSLVTDVHMIIITIMMCACCLHVLASLVIIYIRCECERDYNLSPVYTHTVNQLN